MEIKELEKILKNTPIKSIVEYDALSGLFFIKIYDQDIKSYIVESLEKFCEVIKEMNNER